MASCDTAPQVLKAATREREFGPLGRRDNVSRNLGVANMDIVVGHAQADEPHESTIPSSSVGRSPSPFDDLLDIVRLSCRVPYACISYGAARPIMRCDDAAPPCGQMLSAIIDAGATVPSNTGDLLDLCGDPRTAGNPLVTGRPHLRFALSVPLRDARGVLLGHLTVLDRRQRRRFSRREFALLASLARECAGRLQAVPQSDNIRLRPSTTDQLQTVLDTVPVGVLFAEAPSGRILGGNKRLETMFGHAVYASPDIESYDAWVAYHADGRQVRPEEFPLARVIRQEVERAQLECVYQRPDGSRVWISIEGAPIRDTAGKIVGAVVAVTDISVRRAHEESRELMNQELSHRLKNLFAVVQAIVRQTIRGARDLAALDERIGARLAALGAAHDVLMRGAAERAPMRAVIDRGAGVLGETLRGRLILDGPDIELNGKAALPLGLMIHELLTNAAKYGALSTPEGEVVITWSTHGASGDRLFRLDWQERNGPPVAPPANKGFGTRLIERSLAGFIGSRTDIAYPPEGLRCAIEAPLDALIAEGT